MWTAKFWKQMSERIVKSFVGGVVGYFGIDAVNGFDALSANWHDALSMGLGAGVVSLLLGIASLPLGENDSPSAVTPE